MYIFFFCHRVFNIMRFFPIQFYMFFHIFHLDCNVM
jgi:hypothetical protein